ncbi:MAG TPA: PadR family transcriptional regulator [Clostridiales bacterium]|nr:PadR family transcriptional regulator [Clostridiales bacterium]
MQEKIMRKLFLGFIQVHILHHAQEEPFYGSWMIDELKNHGYDMSPGTLYPILHNMEEEGILKVEKQNVGGKIRKYYSITSYGVEVFADMKHRIRELVNEVKL